MCKLSHDVPDTPNLESLPAPGLPSGGLPSNPGNSFYRLQPPHQPIGSLSGPVANTQLPTPPQPKSKRPTKWAKLLQAVLPIAQGGIAGSFGGDWRVPGSGFQASQNFFTNQANLALRQGELQRQTRDDSFRNQYEAARTQHELQIPPFASAAGRTWTADVDGERHRFRVNPYTGNNEDLGKDTPANRIGIVHAGSKYYGVQETGPQAGTASPITVAPGAGTAPDIDTKRHIAAVGMQNPQNQQAAALRALTEANEEDARDAGPSGTVPLGPPESQEEQQPPTGPPMELTDDSDARRKLPKPRPVTDTDARGVSTTHFVDANPESPTYMQDVKGGKPAATRQPKPSKVLPKPKVEDVEALAQEALKQESGDQAKAIERINRAQIPDGIKSFVRQRIREIRRPGPKQNVLDRYGIAAGDIRKLK
jgi:hypothetical protein